MTANAQFQSDSEDQTMVLAAALAVQLRAGDIIALEGPLGSGKTCFVRGLAQGLGIDPSVVSSPTFVIMQEYQRSKSKVESRKAKGSNPKSKIQIADPPGRNSKSPITLVHIDAYRVNGPDDLETIGWSELLQAPETIIAIEWPSRIGSALPANRIDVAFTHEGEHTRSITITIADDQAKARSELLQIGGSQEAIGQEQRRKSKIERRKGLDMANPKSSDDLNPKSEIQIPDPPRRNPKSTKCRTCGQPIDSTASTFPFCSNRCRLADLGTWFNEGYRVSRPAQAQEEDEIPDE